MNNKSIFEFFLSNGVPEITAEELISKIDKATLIDVRTTSEFNGELSHISESQLIPLGPELDAFLKKHDKQDQVVFICRSGARSAHATLQSRALGFLNTVNLQGGMILWNEKKFPTKKNS